MLSTSQLFPTKQMRSAPVPLRGSSRRLRNSGIPGITKCDVGANVGELPNTSILHIQLLVIFLGTRIYSNKIRILFC